MEPMMKKIEEYPTAPLSKPAPCGLVKWSLLVSLVVLLLTPKNVVSLDCEFATALFEDAAKECEAGVRHEGVKYQPYEYAELLQANYQKCTGVPPVEELQSDFGLVMVLDHMIEYDQLIVAASQKGFKEAKLAALKSCMTLTGEARRCKELDRFGEVCFAVAEARYGTKNDFVTADGDSRGDAEIEAIRWCNEYVPESELWARHCKLMPSECSSDEILCAIEASGCSPYEVVDSMKEFEFRAAQTLEEVSKMHEEPAGKLDDSNTEDPSSPETLEQMRIRLERERIQLEFEAAILAQEIKERFGLRMLEERQKRMLEGRQKRKVLQKRGGGYLGEPRDEQENVITGTN